MAEICPRHHIMICWDEIHCDLLLDDTVHMAIASLAPEVGKQTITLLGPSKTCNIAGLKCSLAVVENQQLREKSDTTLRGFVSHVNVLGYAAALAAHRDGQSWLSALLRYLEASRDVLLDYVQQELPGIGMGKPEGIYLGWLSCHQSNIIGNPRALFRRHAKAALTKGALSRQGGEGFVRLTSGVHT